MVVHEDHIAFPPGDRRSVKGVAGIGPRIGDSVTESQFVYSLRVGGHVGVGQTSVVGKNQRLGRFDQTVEFPVEFFERVSCVCRSRHETIDRIVGIGEKVVVVTSEIHGFGRAVEGGTLFPSLVF